MKRVSSAFRPRAQAVFLGAVAFAAGAAGLRAAAQHESPAAADAAAGAAHAATAPAPAAMRAGIDPETGALGMPVDADSKALALPVPQGPPPQIEVLADGTLRMNVKGHYRNFSVARVGAGGRIETECTHDIDAAQRFLDCEGHAAPAAAPEVK
jgi:hypothetical protein